MRTGGCSDNMRMMRQTSSGGVKYVYDNKVNMQSHFKEEYLLVQDRISALWLDELCAM